MTLGSRFKAVLLSECELCRAVYDNYNFTVGCRCRG